MQEHMGGDAQMFVFQDTEASSRLHFLDSAEERGSTSRKAHIIIVERFQRVGLSLGYFVWEQALLDSGRERRGCGVSQRTRRDDS